MKRYLTVFATAVALIILIYPLDYERLERWGIYPSYLFPKPLNPEDIIRHTNKFRHAQGLPPLTENPLLSTAAHSRAADMLENGYLAHHNPTTGEGPGEAIAAVGYVARVSAENIARGAWRTNEALVQAWIDSPGHRRNILLPDAQEIGVAIVRESILKSSSPRPAYYAVQLFALPLSACGERPGDRERQTITQAKEQIERIQRRIQGIKSEMDSLQSRIVQERNGRERNRLITAYNDLVKKHNALVHRSRGMAETVEVLIASYNRSLTAFNDCRRR